MKLSDQSDSTRLDNIECVEDDHGSKKKEKWRNTFLENLSQKGLELETVDIYLSLIIRKNFNILRF